MSRPVAVPYTDLTAVAAAKAEDAAERAGVVARNLHGLEEINEAAAMLEQIWGGDRPKLSPDLMRAMTHAGHYLAAAYRGSDVVGAIFGFLGQNDRRDYLHSHILGVLPGTQGGGVGYALKAHQAAWALAGHVATVGWTFDPLVRKNAYFNLGKLGALPTEYHINFYGSMDDSLNGTDDSDRFFVSWDVSRWATSSGHPTPEMIEGQDLLCVGADGRPERNSEPPAGGILRCQVPENIQTLREADPEAGRAWRVSLRETMGDAMRRGYRVIGIDRAGHYLLEPPRG